jgi:hypothetical protein
LGRKKRREYDDAQDRLFTEICRCQVLEAAEEDAEEWLDDTVEYLAQEYPALTHEDVHALRQAGENYVAPAIPYGEGRDATNREEWT